MAGGFQGESLSWIFREKSRREEAFQGGGLGTGRERKLRERLAGSGGVILESEAGVRIGRNPGENEKESLRKKKRKV